MTFENVEKGGKAEAYKISMLRSSRSSSRSRILICLCHRRHS